MGDLLTSYLQQMGQGASGNVPQEDDQKKAARMAALQQLMQQQAPTVPRIDPNKAAQVMKAFQ